tara:strand:+ start:408 stop:2675 length:2268 start_codon:yes stop_codon:yes gene_type:complete
MSVLFPGQKGWATEDNIWGVGDRPSDSELEGIRGRLRNSGNKIDSSNSNRKMSEVQYGGGFGRNRGGGGFGGPRRRADGGQDFSAGTPWDSRNRNRGYGSGDIVQQELDRPQRAFEYVQRYPGGYGGQPMGGGGRGPRGGRGPQGPTGGGGFGGGDDNRFDRLIGALEKGWGGSSSSASTAPISNQFNPVFNPTISMTGPNTQVAGGDIRESPITTDTVTTGGGPNTAGRDVNLSGGGDVDTGAGGGNNVVDAGPKSIIEEVDTFTGTGTDKTPPPTNTGGGITGPDPNAGGPDLTGPDPNAGGGLGTGSDGGLGGGDDGLGTGGEGNGTGGEGNGTGTGTGGLNGGGEENNLTIDGGSFLRDQLIQNTIAEGEKTKANLAGTGFTNIDPFAQDGQTKEERHANILFQPGKGSGAGGFVGGKKGVIDTDFEGAIDISGYPGLSPASAKTEDFLGELEGTGTGGGTQNANTTVDANTSAITGDNTMTAGGDIIGSSQDNTAIATGGLNIAGGNINQTGGGDISTVGGGGNVVNANLGNISGGQNLSATTDLNNPPEPSAWDQLSDDEKYITDLYVRGLNRSPEEQGMEYWLNELASGSLEKGSSLDASILGSAEAKTKDDAGITEGVYQSTDDYLAGGGKGGNPFVSNYIQNNNNVFNEDAPELKPGDPFYVDPDFDFDAEVAKLADNPNYFSEQIDNLGNDPNNPFADINAQLQLQKEQEQAELDDLQAKADAAGGWFNLSGSDLVDYHQKLYKK